MNMAVPVTRGVNGLRGVGALGQNCPSMQQLQGIVDATDPCQSSTFATTVPNATPVNSTAAALAAGSTSNALTSMLSGVSGSTWVIVGGIVLAAIFLGRGR